MNLINTLISKEARYKRHKFIYMKCPKTANYTETESYPELWEDYKLTI